MDSYRNIVLIGLFFLIATAPRTHGIVMGDVAQVNILGRLSCVVPGTLPSLSSPPLRGVSVNITCNGGTITLGQAITDKAGFLNATFNILEGHRIDTSTCMGTVNLSSIANCKLFPRTGILRVSFIILSVVRGVVQLLTVLAFV